MKKRVTTKSPSEKTYRKEVEQIRRRYEELQKTESIRVHGDDYEDSVAEQVMRAFKEGDFSAFRKESKEITSDALDATLETPLPTTLANELLPILKIVKGTIYTEDRRKVKIMEFLPINFHLKSAEEQSRITECFEKMLRACPAKVQFKTLALRADVTKFIKGLEEQYESETNDECRKLIKDQEELILSTASTTSVSRRFFVIFEDDRTKGLADETAESILREDAEQIASMLHACGNVPVSKGDSTDETARILYDILNRDSYSSADFPKRVGNITGFYASNYGIKDRSLIPITEYFAPESIDMEKNHPDYIKINDTYYSFLYLRSSDGYPNVVGRAWLSGIVARGPGYDCDIFVHRQSKRKMQTRITRHMTWNIADANTMNNTTTQYDTTMDKLSAGDYLKKQMKDGNDFWYVTVLLTITSKAVYDENGVEDKKKSIEDLKTKVSKFRNDLQSDGMYAADCNWILPEAFQSYLPLCKLSGKIYKKAKRNVVTSDLSSFYPFPNYEKFSNDGIFLGTNMQNHSLVAIDPYSRAEGYPSANGIVCGSTGTGKSTFLRLYTTRLRMKQHKVFIVLPEKAREFRRCCKRLGGTFISLAPGGNDRINPFEIRKKNDSILKAIDGVDDDTVILSQKIQELHTFFQLLLPTMSADEDELLDEALMDLYRSMGFTFSNDSLYDPENPTQYRKMPIMSDLYKILNHKAFDKKGEVKDKDYAHLVRLLTRYVNGSIKTFDGQTNVDLDNLYTVIDLESMKGKAMAASIYLTFELVYGKATENILEITDIIMDEAWSFLSSNEQAARQISTAFRVIRGLGGSILLASQNFSDYTEDHRNWAENWGKGIVNCAPTKFIFGVQKKEAEVIREALGLSEDEQEQIIKSMKTPGIALVCANGDNIMVQMMISFIENVLYTTDPKQLKEYVELGYLGSDEVSGLLPNS